MNNLQHYVEPTVIISQFAIILLYRVLLPLKYYSLAVVAAVILSLFPARIITICRLLEDYLQIAVVVEAAY
jgi:hypothetical protein